MLLYKTHMSKVKMADLRACSILFYDETILPGNKAFRTWQSDMVIKKLMLRQVEKYLAMCVVEGWRRGHKFWKKSPALLEPCTPILCFALQIILWLVSSISGFLLTFQAKGKCLQTQPSPPATSSAPASHMGERPPVMWLSMTGLHALVQAEPCWGQKGLFVPGTMTLWPVNLSLDCSPTMVWSSSNTSSKRERDFRWEKK